MPLFEAEFNQSTTQVAEISTPALAYLGDAVYELHIRMCYLKPPRSASIYHQLVVAKVRAENQAKQLDQLIHQLILSESESALVKRGRNAAGSSSRNVDPVIYQKATGFEALIGYLYLTDRDRLHQIFQIIDHEI
jgi:ribonuclease III family protein